MSLIHEDSPIVLPDDPSFRPEVQVDYPGYRSTRWRAPDRPLVTIPEDLSGRELGPARPLVVGREPLRLAGLVDDVERARVGDARHDQRDELVGTLAGPAPGVGDPLHLDE